MTLLSERLFSKCGQFSLAQLENIVYIRQKENYSSDAEVLRQALDNLVKTKYPELLKKEFKNEKN